MIWGIIFDVILWVATIALFIFAWTTPSFIFFILGLVCLLLAIVLLCILTGFGASASSSLIDDILDI